MKYCAIASGSNGNCYYIAKGETAILVDAGINNKHIHLRMFNLGIDPTKIKAVFITHEHTDHIRGLSVFVKKYDIPVYITEGSYEGTRLHLPAHLVHYIDADTVTTVGEMKIYGIPKYHDAKEPCSFLISDGTYNIGVLTDIGRPCKNVQHVIKHSDVLLLESNFDEDMLKNGRYSYFLKNRISSGWGHLSNTVALDLFINHRSPRLKHLMLTHLSGENNTVEIVHDTFRPHCEDIFLSVATRFEETEIFDIHSISVQAECEVVR
ncbi:beta-lactamase [Sphingobacterium sp. ML3W]|uniref:MBL fold metallo-hydrolase n=1 Tax=Sphingobacterium TaxID=28453 RepID=UPI0004F6206B|nr:MULTISPECIES: MBL fold metallo-hydrolase [Sphingobacterium]AIM38918.1 beta-lactamase [Sphingobacterium sp. ML3W]MDH5825091.1 MBL fold metallo-hydrolase [Sphingobacterium faecium]